MIRGIFVCRGDGSLGLFGVRATVPVPVAPSQGNFVQKFIGPDTFCRLYRLSKQQKRIESYREFNPTTITIQLFNDYRAIVRRIFARCTNIYSVLARLHYEVVVVVVPYTHRMVRSVRVNRDGNLA